MKKSLLVYIMSVVILAACGNDNIVVRDYDIVNDTAFAIIHEESILNPRLDLYQGHISEKADTFRVVSQGKNAAIIILSSPKQVVQADKEYDWGYYQFPNFYHNAKGDLIVRWQMADDSYTSYGYNGSDRERRMSRDDGETWTELDKDYPKLENCWSEMADGSVLKVITPPSMDISKYKDFPCPVNQEPLSGGYSFYRMNELPDSLQGVYLQFYKNDIKVEDIHASVNDSEYLRYSINNYMPIVWWGDIKELKDGSVLAGMYPVFYKKDDGNITSEGVGFYKSIDNCRNWNKIGVLFYPSANSDVSFGNGLGFTEPTYEILNDSTLICVMRTGGLSPLYVSYSHDLGINWSIPAPMTPNGVYPHLLSLGNGALVLSSGRPGAQLRFSIDGKGTKWTEPIEMMPIFDENGQLYSEDVTCGYTQLLKADENSFFIVYSDFKTQNNKGEYRKSIMFRKVEVLTNL